MSDALQAARPRVLIVDDELAARLIMQATLEEAGFAVTAAASVAEARAALDEGMPDLLILDVLLPDGDGISLCAEIRARPDGRAVPIAMATGLDDTHSISMAYQSGATDFITKPISWGTLGHRVRYLLRSYQLLQELAVSESKTRALLSSLPDMIFRIDNTGRVIDQQAGSRMHLLAEWDIPPQSCLEDHLPAMIAQLLRRETELALQHQQARNLEFAMPEVGLQRHWEVRLVPHDEHEALLVVRDITRRKEMENQLRLSAKVFETSNEAIMITDARNHIISVNRMFEVITGYRQQEVLGRDPSLLGSGRETRSFFRNLWWKLQEGGAWQGEINNRRKSGEDYPAWMSIHVIRDAHGDPEYHIASFSDISERKQQEAQIQQLAFHDGLTGLPNRRLLSDRIEMAIAHAWRERAHLAVLFIDLDRFKTINDSMGHAVGDELLKQVAQRLAALVRSGDTVSRVGGDEFVVLSPGCHQPSDAAALGEKILHELAQPFWVQETRVQITPSIGIALFPENGTDASSLIGNADAAMYQAKENERNNCQFYSQELNERNRERVSLDVRMRQALESDQFVLYFQPQINAISGELTAVETLIRWHDPSLGLVPPMRFIPLAEESGFIQNIGEWVVQRALGHVRSWQNMGLGAIPVAVNISARQFKQPGFTDLIVRSVQEAGIDPHLLELEITESMLMKDVGMATRKLRELKKLGFRIAIDDFGTGFSSLNYLRHFPIDVLKIDQSFVRELLEDEAALAIIEAIIALARALGMRTIAEGVETVAQRDLLRERGCDILQGFLLSRPLPEAEFIQWLRTRRGDMA